VHSVHVHMKPHHQAVVKTVMLKFVIEVWLKCIEITMTNKKVISFYRKNCGGPTKTVHSAEIDQSSSAKTKTGKLRLKMHRKQGLIFENSKPAFNQVPRSSKLAMPKLPVVSAKVSVVC